MGRDVISNAKAHQGFLLLLLLASLLFLTNIGSYQQLLRAESNFSLRTQMMLEANEFLLPHAPHERPLNKTPLQNWLMGISYTIFGINHGASRVPSALCALGVLALVYLLGSCLRDQRVGLAASAMLATSYIFWSFSRLCMADMLLTLCITAALVCWILVLTDRTQHPHTLALIGSAAVGVGFLAKGPVAIVLALLPIVMEMIITRDWSMLKRLKPIGGVLVFLLVAAPYFFLVYVFDGGEPLRNFFIEENLRRFTGTGYKTSSIRAVYEVSALLADFAPWSPLVVIAACSLAMWKKLDTTTKQQLRLLFLWIISPVVFFSLSSFKLDYYFLPAMPPLALLVAQCLLQEGVLPQWARRVRLTIGVVALILLPFLLYFTALIVKANFPDSKVAWLPHILAVMTLLPAIWFAMQGWTYRLLLACSFTMWVTIFSAYLVLLPDYTRFQPAATLASHVPSKSTVYLAGPAGEWIWDLSLYLSVTQRVQSIPHEGLSLQVQSLLQTDPGAVFMMYETEYRELGTAEGPLRIIAQAEAYKNNRLTLKTLLKPVREPLYLLAR